MEVKLSKKEQVRNSETSLTHLLSFTHPSSFTYSSSFTNPSSFIQQSSFIQPLFMQSYSYNKSTDKLEAFKNKLKKNNYFEEDNDINVIYKSTK
jgi:hypothetical protein